MSTNTATAKKETWPIKCLVVLTGICLVVSLLMGLTNSLTAPIIEAGTIAREEEARKEMLPAADGFEEVALNELPDGVKAVYRATNGRGYVFMLSAKGYGSDPMSLICGIDENDCIVACKTLSHTETAGLGAKTAEEEYRSQYAGQDESLSGVHAISGATISSTAYYKAVKAAFEALDMAKEAAN